MTHIWQRIGAEVYELHIELAGGILYRARYDGGEVYFECDGDEIDVIGAACDVVERRVNENPR